MCERTNAAVEHCVTQPVLLEVSADSVNNDFISRPELVVINDRRSDEVFFFGGATEGGENISP